MRRRKWGSPAGAWCDGNEVVAGSLRPAKPFRHQGDEASIADAIFDLDELAAELEDAAGSSPHNNPKVIGIINSHFLASNY
jgi:hypothetical protein